MIHVLLISKAFLFLHLWL